MARLKEILSFANNKGGVGKTTTVLNVAAGLLKLHPKYRILCIDVDPQCSLSTLMGWRNIKKENPQFKTVNDALKDGDNNQLPVYRCNNGIFLCPSSQELTYISSDLQRQMLPNNVLRSLEDNPVDDVMDVLPKDEDGYAYIGDCFDYVLIDCPPSLGNITYNALAASTGVIIPMQLEPLAIDGLGHIISACRKVKQMKEKLNEEFDIRGILITMEEQQQQISKQYTRYLKDEYPDMLFHTRIKRRTDVKKAQNMLMDIFSYNANSQTSDEYLTFVKELIK